MAKLSSRFALSCVLCMPVAAAAAFPLTLEAQTSFGSVVGTVTDATRAVVPDAAVTLTDTATNEVRTARSNSSGDFSFVSLPPATYKVEVEKAGFKSLLRDQIIVTVNTTIRADAALQVGTSNETVEVSTQSPLLQTDSGTLGTVVEGKTIEEMPLNGRNTMNLLALAPGVIPTPSANGSAANAQHTTASSWSSFSIGGGLVGQSTMYVDGAPINLLGGGGTGSVGFVPTQDAVQEFHVANSGSSSEFGRYSGGVVNIATKSGTNSFHGTAYEYLRNRALNANEFFNKAAQLNAKQPNVPTKYNQHQFGGQGSAPIKRDKIFVMGSYERFTARTTSLQSRTVPTPDMFAGVIDGVNITTQANTIHPGCGATYNAATNSTTIPKSCWDSSAAVMATEWPTQTTTGTAVNFQKQSPSGSDFSTYIGRVDYVINAKNRLFARYAQMNLNDTSQEWMPGGVMPNGQPWHIGGGTTVNHAINGVLGETYTINPSTILDVRLSSLRVYNAQDTPTHGLDLSVFGSNWGNLQKQMTFTNIPTINFTDPCPAGVVICAPTAFANSSQVSFQWNDNQALVFSLTKIRGAHNIKVGGEARFMDRYVLSEAGGALSASGSYTFSSSYFTGSAWANFLLGTPNSAYLTTVREVGSYNWYQGYFVNDTWQVNRKFTINAGIRWELPGNIKEKKDNAMVLAPNATDPATGVYGTAYLVNSSLYGDRGTTPAKHNIFAPNLGFAYRISDNDVVRAGYGYSVAAIDIQGGVFPENLTLNSYSNTFDYGATGQYYSLNNPFSNGLLQPISRSAFSTSRLLKSSVTAPQPTTALPYTQQWNVAVSHQFPGNALIEVAWSGSLAVHLPLTYNYNELAPAYWNDPTLRLAAGTTPTASVSATQLAACRSVWTSGTTYGQCARPHSAYLNYIDAVGPYGTLNYNALPVRVEKRFRSAGVVTASFTWTKSIGNLSSLGGGGSQTAGTVQDWYNLKAERSVTQFSVPRRLVLSYVLNLPFGKGQKFLGNSNGVVSHLVSGWAFNGITTFADGYPLAILANEPGGTINIPATYGAGPALRPNYLAGCNKYVGGGYKSHVLSGTPVFNTSCFSAPAATYSLNGTNYATTLGNEPRVDSNLRTPGYNNFDLSLQKNTAIAEGVSLEFRMEYFNAFNHERFGGPGNTVNSGGSTPFGVVNGGSTNAGMPRLGQASLRLSF